MANPLDGTLNHLRNLAAIQSLGGMSDGELMDRFVQTSDESAFTVLLHRHGRMVLGVCRRALANECDAEDACQATFLVLALKAESLRQKASLSSWLHGVASRVSATLKREAVRRARRERDRLRIPVSDPAADVSWREMQGILDEELQRLPEQYRTPLVLCYLECLTRDEAAKQLALSPGRLHGRLERGRDLLRQRLTKRGLTLSAVMTATALGEGVSRASLSPSFVVTSGKAAALIAARESLAEVVSTQVLALTQEVIKNMSLVKMKLGMTAAICGVLIVGVGVAFADMNLLVTPKPDAKERQFGETVFLNRVLQVEESDEAFIKRMSKDLRGSDPTETEIHFFKASKEPNKRQTLVDLFIQERQARQKAQQALLDQQRKLEMLSLYYKQIEWHKSAQFYQNLAANKKEAAELAKINQEHLDRLTNFVKENPKSTKLPDVIRQIVQIYQAQGKTVEADAWGAKLPKSLGEKIKPK